MQLQNERKIQKVNGQPLLPNPKRTLESNLLVSKINFSHYDSIANWLLPCGISLVAASVELKSRPFGLLQRSGATRFLVLFQIFQPIMTVQVDNVDKSTCNLFL